MVAFLVTAQWITPTSTLKTVRTGRTKLVAMFAVVSVWAFCKTYMYKINSKHEYTYSITNQQHSNKSEITCPLKKCDQHM